MKIKEFQDMLEKKNLDAAVFYNSEFPRINPNMVYFSGYTGLGVLVVPRRKEPFLIAPEMEFQKAKKSMIRKVFSMQKKRFFESVSDIIKINGIKTKNIAIDRNNFTLNSFKYFRKSFRKSKFKDVAMNCIKLREIKSNKEIEYLKKSCGYADKIIQKTINNFKGFKTESEAAAFLEYETKKLGLELSFNPIVASGSNGSMPHHEPKNKRMKKGLCVIDFGDACKGAVGQDVEDIVSSVAPETPRHFVYEQSLKILNKQATKEHLQQMCYSTAFRAPYLLGRSIAYKEGNPSEAYQTTINAIQEIKQLTTEQTQFQKFLDTLMHLCEHLQTEQRAHSI